VTAPEAVPDVPATPARPGRSCRHPIPDPFDGMFACDRPMEPIVDVPGAHAWFELFRWSHDDNLYTYQLPLASQPGPHVTIHGRSMLMLSSYDYLGLNGHPVINRAATEAVNTFGTGPGGVRLLTGTTTLHREFEVELAEFKGTEAALTFSSGYVANLAVIPALVGPRDRVVVDARVHRSIVDACRLSRATVERFSHNDVQSLAACLDRSSGRTGRTLIVVEGVYSMDGDVCPLPEIVALKDHHGAFLMVDEAHSFGVLGSTGRGVDEMFGLDASRVEVWTGSLSKAIPANGGFVAGSKALVVYLQHGGAPFMFSSALCPAATAAARASLRVLRAEPSRIAALRRNGEVLRTGLRDRGYDTGASTTSIIPVILGDDERAFRIARQLYDAGLLVTAVVQPAVPRDGARLRLCATAGHDRSDIVRALDLFEEVGR